MVLIWHEGALGDLLLSRLAVAALRRRFPGKRLILLARSEARRLFLEAGLVDEAYPTSLALLSAFKEKECLYLFAHRKEAYGFLKPLAPRVYFIPTRPMGPKHLALSQLESLSSPLIPEAFFLKRLPSGDKVVFHPGSGARFKCAPPAFWQKLAALLKEAGEEVVFLLGPAERGLAERGLKETLGGEEIVLASNLQEAEEILYGTKAFLGHDSGLSHLAAALGLETLALFGPTAWWHWAPYGRVTVVAKACRCLAQGLSPRDCERPCLTTVKAEEMAQIFFSTTPRSYPRRADFGPPDRPAGAEEGEGWRRSPGAEGSGVPELGIRVVAVEGGRFPRG